jgi:hypothetical protein
MNGRLFAAKVAQAIHRKQALRSCEEELAQFSKVNDENIYDWRARKNPPTSADFFFHLFIEPADRV